MRVLTDNIVVWDNCFSTEWCNSLISIVDTKMPDDVCARGINKIVQGVKYTKNDKRFDAALEMKSFGSMQSYKHDIEKVLKQCLGDMKKIYHSMHEWDDLDPIDTKIQKTPPGGGFSKWHYEQGAGVNDRCRWGVWMLYLNTIDKSGTTDFAYQNLSIKPEAGTVVIWPAAYTHLHRSSPHLNETKYIVTGWFSSNDNRG